MQAVGSLAILATRRRAKSTDPFAFTSMTGASFSAARSGAALTRSYQPASASVWQIASHAQHSASPSSRIRNDAHPQAQTQITAGRPGKSHHAVIHRPTPSRRQHETQFDPQEPSPQPRHASRSSPKLSNRLSRRHPTLPQRIHKRLRRVRHTARLHLHRRLRRHPNRRRNQLGLRRFNLHRLRPNMFHLGTS
jgi:hypothetical protein